MEKKKVGLLVIDVQNDFFPGGVLPVAGAPNILNPLNKLIDAFYVGNSPTFISRDFHPPKHKSFKPKGPYPPHCLQGSHGAQINSGVNFNRAVIIDKCYSKDDDNMSAFGDGRLQRMLSMSGISEVLVAGLSTEYGIRATVLDALKIGLQVLVVEDAIAPTIPVLGDKAIAEMVKLGAQFISLKEALNRVPAVKVFK